MDKELPNWLDDRFLMTVLQDGDITEQKVTVLKFSAKLAVAAGNNYTSIVWRVLVQYKTELSLSDKHYESLIIKAPIEKGVLSEKMEEGNFFDSEQKIYKKLLPEMCHKINIQFGPKSFYCPLKDGMVLKDLNAEGYVMCDKFKQMDFIHCKSVFETLAKYHATSVACYHDDSGFIDSIGEKYKYKDGGTLENVKPWVEAAVQHCGEILRSTHGQQTIADLISSKADTIWDSMVNICKRKTSGLNVLNHGDCWTNNILFKHKDSGEIVDIKLIDFQLPIFASPVIDLIYFIYTSANEEVREHKLQYLYNIYLNTLNNTLKDLCCEERLTVEEFQEDLRSAADWAVYIICFQLPMMNCEPEEAINLEDINLEDLKVMKDNDSFKTMYTSKPFLAQLPIVSRHYQVSISS